MNGDRLWQGRALGAALAWSAVVCLPAAARDGAPPSRTAPSRKTAPATQARPAAATSRPTRAPREPVRTVIRVYDVRDLAGHVAEYRRGFLPDGWEFLRDVPARRLEAIARLRREEWAAGADAGQGSRDAAIDVLISALKAHVAPRSWAAPAPGRVRALHGQLVVTQTPEVHKAVDRFLGPLRKSSNVVIAFACRIVTAPPRLSGQIQAQWTPLSRPRSVAWRDRLPKAGWADPAKPVGRAEIITRRSMKASWALLDSKQVDRFLEAIPKHPTARLVTAPWLRLWQGRTAYIYPTGGAAELDRSEEDLRNLPKEAAERLRRGRQAEALGHVPGGRAITLLGKAEKGKRIRLFVQIEITAARSPGRPATRPSRPKQRAPKNGPLTVTVCRLQMHATVPAGKTLAIRTSRADWIDEDVQDVKDPKSVRILLVEPTVESAGER